jgi:solute carrier family 35, member F1/2
MAPGNPQVQQEFAKSSEGDSAIVQTTYVEPEIGKRNSDHSGLTDAENGVAGRGAPVIGADGTEVRISRRKTLLGYVKTKQFWLVLVFGQILSLCIVGTNTTTQLLSLHGTSIPAFQSFFNYVLLNIVWTSITMYKYGIKGWGRMVYQHGWKCRFSHSHEVQESLQTLRPLSDLILSFCDVEGNYFTVLGYR